MQHEACALANLLQRIAPCSRLSRRLVDAGEQHHGNRGEGRGKSERRCGPDRPNQNAAECRTTGKRNRARQFDPRIGSRQQLWQHQRGN
jgi:hypothetical protein